MRPFKLFEVIVRPPPDDAGYEAGYEDGAEDGAGYEAGYEDGAEDGAEDEDDNSRLVAAADMQDALRAALEWGCEIVSITASGRAYVAPGAAAEVVAAERDG